MADFKYTNKDGLLEHCKQAVGVIPSSRFIVYGLLDPNSYELRYVGRSSSGLRRAKNHVWNLIEHEKRYSHLRLYRWIAKIKKNNQKPLIAVLEECLNEKQVASQEKYWIALARSLGYDLTNLSDGGEGNCGHVNFWKGKKRNPQSIEKVAQQNRGRKWSSEEKERMSRQRKNRVVTDSTRLSLSKISRHKKPVVDNFGNIFSSVSEAGAALEICATNVTRSLKNPNVTVAGLYKFTYLNPEDANRQVTKSIYKIIDQYGTIYDSAKAAALAIDMTPSSIYAALKNEKRTARGFYLRYLKEEKNG